MSVRDDCELVANAINCLLDTKQTAPLDCEMKMRRWNAKTDKRRYSVFCLRSPANGTLTAGSPPKGKSMTLRLRRNVITGLAFLVAGVGLAMKRDRSQSAPNSPSGTLLGEHRTDDLREGQPQRFGDYLQDLSEQHGLLRREY
jgi:hypothetical protein